MYYLPSSEIIYLTHLLISRSISDHNYKRNIIPLFINSFLPFSNPQDCLDFIGEINVLYNVNPGIIDYFILLNNYYLLMFPSTVKKVSIGETTYIKNSSTSDTVRPDTATPDTPARPDTPVPPNSGNNLDDMPKGHPPLVRSSDPQTPTARRLLFDPDDNEKNKTVAQLKEERLEDIRYFERNPPKFSQVYSKYDSKSYSKSDSKSVSKSDSNSETPTEVIPEEISLFHDISILFPQLHAYVSSDNDEEPNDFIISQISDFFNQFNLTIEYDYTLFFHSFISIICNHSIAFSTANKTEHHHFRSAKFWLLSQLISHL
jgi:hypothetical protein